MKQNEWNEGLNHIDSDLIEEFVEMGERLQAVPKQRGVWLRFGVIAACLCLLVGVGVALPILQEPTPSIPTPAETTYTPTEGTTKDEPPVVIPNETTKNDSPSVVPNDTTAENPPVVSPPDTPDIPINRPQVPTSAPFYYGSNDSQGGGGGSGEIDISGISVTARYKGGLPDTYTFYDDWDQVEFGLIRMETVKQLDGSGMADEFYYVIPAAYMTDFSIFDTFVLSNIGQYGYEFSVLYNVTDRCAEELDLAIFGANSLDFVSNYMSGFAMMVFDENGVIDPRLSQAGELWKEETERVLNFYGTDYTLAQAEEKEQEYLSNFHVYTLDHITDEAANVLNDIKGFKNGIFVPDGSGQKLFGSAAYLNCTRFIDGFPTNEYLRIHVYEDDANVYQSKAQFTEDDLNALPDLPSAVVSVTAAFQAGKITPPHITKHLSLTPHYWGYSIFAWYAKTDNGVIGVIRINWRFNSDEDWPYADYFDDAYYIIEYGSEECSPIDRDALLERLGSCESGYVFLGEYTENGKDVPIMPYY